MRKNLIFLSLILSFIGAGLQSADAKNVLRGTLLKSTLKPLPYTEIELIPVNSDKFVNDGRLLAISVPSGKFAFHDVPDGEYTLSINFGEKPTELSPYTTCFFPVTKNRQDAKTFQFKGDTLIEGVVFRLPPPLVQRKVTGKVINSSGNPMSDVYVNLRDLEFDEVSFAFTLKTDKNGEFSLKGFNGRDYEVVAMVTEKMVTTFDPVNVIASGKSDTFTLGEKTPSLTVKVRLPEERFFNDKNVGKLFSRRRLGRAARSA